MSDVEIPESVRAYFCDAAVATATNALLDNKKNRTTLAKNWEGLPTEFRSYIAAHQIKADYIHTLWTIWEAVWKPVLAERGLGADSFISLEELSADGESNSSISEIWDQGLPLQRIYRRENGNQFNFGVDFQGKNNGVRLLCWLISKDDTENLELGENWLDDLIDAEWRVTKSFQLERDEKYLKIDKLIECADQAATQMLGTK